MKHCKYKPNLEHYMALCAANYRQLQSLLARQKQPTQTAGYDLKVTEQSRYTTCLLLEPQVGFQPWLKRQRLQIRLYHDASVAEVFGLLDENNKLVRLQSRYQYPNQNMLQRDEKHQLNQFLYECLKHALAGKLTICTQ